MRHGECQFLSSTVPRAPKNDGFSTCCRGRLQGCDPGRDAKVESWRRAPREEREDITLHDLSRQFAKDKRRKQEEGYSELDVLSANLSASISVPAGVAALKIEYRIPAEVNRQKGYFEIDIECFVEEAQPVNWVIHDLDVDFRSE